MTDAPFTHTVARMADLYTEHRAAADVALGSDDAASWERLTALSGQMDALTTEAAVGVADLINALDDGRGDQNATMHFTRTLASHLDRVHLGTTVHAYLEALEPETLARALGMGALRLAAQTGPDGDFGHSLDGDARRAAEAAVRFLTDALQGGRGEAR